MVLKLYLIHLSPPARAVRLTAEALGLELQLIEVNMSEGEHLKSEYLKINPQHTVPTLDDNGTIIWDSHAICAYLVNKYGKDDSLYPKDAVKRALVDQRLHFDTGAIFNWVRTIVRPMIYKGVKIIPQDQIDGVIEGYAFLETFLEKTKWVAGDSVTIADFCLLASVTSLNEIIPIDAKKFPNVKRWIAQAETLPYFHVNKMGTKLFKEFVKGMMAK